MLKKYIFKSNKNKDLAMIFLKNLAETQGFKSVINTCYLIILIEFDNKII